MYIYKERVSQTTIKLIQCQLEILFPFAVLLGQSSQALAYSGAGIWFTYSVAGILFTYLGLGIWCTYSMPLFSPVDV